MVRFADAARLKLEGLPTDVDQHSPLDAQVSFIYQAMHQYALKNNWEAFRRGQVTGHKGPFTLKYLIEQLFPKATSDERQVIQQIASSVLRQTGAAVCLHNPSPTERADGVKPTWYVADRMPDNLMIVATHHKGGPTPGPPDRLTQVANKLTPKEAGEDREPAPVEVRQVNKDTPEPSKAERDMIVNDQFLTEVYEQVATSRAPLTIPELSLLTDKPQWAVRHATEKLVADKRLFWRVETREEKRVRGGGQLPPARPSKLFWPADPVPERTQLPPGIEPVKSSRDHAKERVNERRADDELVFNYLGSDDATNRGRSSGKIAAEINLPVQRVKDALRRLTNAGRLRVNSAYLYYHAGQQAFPSSGIKPAPRTPAPPPLPGPVTADEDEPADMDLLNRIYSLVDELAREAGYEIEEAEGNEAEVTELREKVVALSVENSELKRENADLKAKVEKINKLLS